MKLVRAVTKWLWWLGLGYVPFALTKVSKQFANSIGCPPAGDCYVPGSELLVGLDLLILGLYFYLWPVCAWFLGGRVAIGWARKMIGSRLTSQSSETPR